MGNYIKYIKGWKWSLYTEYPEGIFVMSERPIECGKK